MLLFLSLNVATGSDPSLADLIDFLAATQAAKAADGEYPLEEKVFFGLWIRISSFLDCFLT